MDILYIAHCVPWPPDGGERIRAFQSVRRLMERHRVHLACIARTPAEAASASPLRDQLASARIEVLDVRRAMLRGCLAVARGRSFAAAFHTIPELRAHVRSLLERNPIQAVVLLSSATAGYAPTAVPFLADWGASCWDISRWGASCWGNSCWGDLHSQQRLNETPMRSDLVHRLGAHLLRRDERRCARRARRTFLATPGAQRWFQRIVPDASLGCAGHGVDVAYFDPDRCPDIPDPLATRRYLLFTGGLDDASNVDGLRWFADQVLPELRRRDPGLDLLLVGRRPAREILALGERDGIVVTGAVEDVRPCLAAAHAVIAPLRPAYRVRNTVLEALAMGKCVLASDPVCRSFLPNLPPGVVRCDTAGDYVAACAGLPGTASPTIRDAARLRFSWNGNLAPIVAELDAIEREGQRLRRAA